MVSLVLNFLFTAAWLLVHFLIVVTVVYLALGLHYLAARLSDKQVERLEKTL